MDAIWSLIGVLIGSGITFLVSNLNRKQQEKLFGLERKDKFRIVAIEKRLEAHQLALFHWFRMRDVIHEKNEINRNTILNEAQMFWNTHSLYLEKQTRERFSEIIFIITFYQDKLLTYRNATSKEEKESLQKEIKSDWN